MSGNVLLRQRPGLQSGTVWDSDHSFCLQRSYKSKSRGRGRRARDSQPTNPHPVPNGSHGSSMGMHGHPCFCLLLGLPGEWKAGFLLLTEEDEKEIKHHKQVACQGPQGPRGSLQGSGVPEGQALSKSDLSRTQEGPGLLHPPALRQGGDVPPPPSQQQA